MERLLIIDRCDGERCYREILVPGDAIDCDRSDDTVRDEAGIYSGCELLDFGLREYRLQLVREGRDQRADDSSL